MRLLLQTARKLVLAAKRLMLRIINPKMFSGAG